MDDFDEQDLKHAELKYCLDKSLDHVDRQALEDVKSDKEMGDGTEGEEETPDEWHVDVRYASRLLKRANELRARKRLCDVTIGLADGKLEAHKSLLAAGSPFFKHLTETTRANTLNFFHVPCSVADILFDFMYTGEISPEKVAKLSRSEKRLLREKADLFQISDQLEPLWKQLDQEAGQPEIWQPAAGPFGDSSDIVRRKVLYMNEKRKDGDFADWKIRISAVDIPVSKVFLAVSSTYFADFFARNPMDARSETYTLTELNRRTFRKVLNFIYTGHVITESRELGALKDLLFQATYLGIGELATRLVAEMESRLDAENCFQLFAYANTINCRQLVKSVSRYVGLLGAESAKCTGFLGLKVSDLRAALLNPELQFNRGPCLLYPTEFERCVFDLLLAWIRVDHVRRSSHVTELFELVEKLGATPYTGHRDRMHDRMPKELNHVMSLYYSKLRQEQKSPTGQQPPDAKQAVRARRNLLPTRLLVSREYPMARPQSEDAALLPEALPPSDAVEGVQRCWQLPPTDWKLQSVRIFAADEALTRLTGLEMRFQRYPLFLDESSADAATALVRCGYHGAFDRHLELLATERISQLGIVKDTSGVGTGGNVRTCIAWAKTCIGRRLEVVGTGTAEDRPEEVVRSLEEVVRSPEEAVRSPEEVVRSPEEVVRSPEEVIRSPEGSRGFLHGLDLRFEGLGGAAGGALTVLWAVEADVHGLGDGPWSSVIENE